MKRWFNYIGLLLAVNLGFANLALSQTTYPWMLRLNWANDFVFQTDYYFTNGMSLEVWNHRLQASPLNYLLIPHQDGNHVYYGLSLKQDIFTPVDTGKPYRQYNDRPFASYWLMGSTKKSINADYSLALTSGFYFGMMGKAGGGELVQNGIHDLLPTSGHVKGWEHQLNNSLCLNYRLDLERNLYRNSFFKLSGTTGGMIGTPYTNLNGGINLYFGKFGKYPGFLFAGEHAQFHLYGFSKINAKWVLYNATLQGGLFKNNQSSMNPAPVPWVLNLQNGISVKYKSFTVELGQNMVTPEFAGAKSHNWGYVSFSLAF